MVIQPVSLIYLLIGFMFFALGGLISGAIITPKAGSKISHQDNLENMSSRLCAYLLVGIAIVVVAIP